MESRTFVTALALGLSGCAAPPHGPTLRRFEATLRAQDSATAALGEWCIANHIADPATMRAQPIESDAPPPSPEIRRLLEVGANEAVRYRHVRLICGPTVLSVAQNWYVPARLTPDMNRTLETTEIPFGRVVHSLGYTRTRLSSRNGAAEDCPAGTVLSHRAVLKRRDGRPISLVVECYTAANLATAR